MKHTNKRLIVSLAALVISIALAATSTFAWFTMDATPEVSNINLTVTAQSGLEISYLYETSAGVYSQSAYRSYIDFYEDADGEGPLTTTFAEYLQNLILLEAVTPSDEGAYPIIGYVYEKENVTAGDEDNAGAYVFVTSYPNSVYEQEEVDIMQTENEAEYSLDTAGRKIVIRAYGAGGAFEYVYQKEGVDPGDALTAGDYVVTEDTELTQAKDGGEFVYEADGTTPVYISATTNVEAYALDFGGNKKIIRAYTDTEGNYVYVYERTGVSAGTPTSAGAYTFSEPMTYEAEPQALVNVQASDVDGLIYDEEEGIHPVYIHKTTSTNEYVTPKNCIPAYGTRKEYTASSTTNFLTVDAGSNKAVAATAHSYAALRFRFRSLSNYKVHLTDAAVTSTAYHGDFLDWDGVDGGGTVLNTNAANAARIGFSESTYVPATDIYTKGPSITKVYEPNDDKGYDAGTGTDGAGSYYKFITGNDNPIPDPGYTAIHDSDLSNVANNVVLSSMTLATTGANAGYFVGEITIYLWIEGADYDCFNIVLGDDLAINLSFTGTAL